jgi:plasmid rolling circle replication initiator protein Rep
VYTLNEQLKKQKFQSDKLGKLFEKSNILRDSGINMHKCCDFITLSADLNGEVKPIQISFCRQKYCPTCSKRKSLRAYAIGMRLFEELENDFAFIHMVLTVKNCTADDLRNTIKKLHTSSSKLLRGEICSVFKGCLRCLEISYNEERNDFHPHLHCLVAVNKSYFKSRYYVSQQVLSNEWANIVGQTYASVYISRIKEPEKAVAEICKYCLKPFSVEDPNKAVLLYEILYSKTKHTRHTQTYGVIRDTLRKLRLDFEKDDELSIEFDLDEFDDLSEVVEGRTCAYAFDRKSKKYIPVETWAKK